MCVWGGSAPPPTPRPPSRRPCALQNVPTAVLGWHGSRTVLGYAILFNSSDPPPSGPSLVCVRRVLTVCVGSSPDSVRWKCIPGYSGFFERITPLPGLLLHLVFVFDSRCWPFFVVYDVMIFARLKADLHRITKKLTRECYLLSSTTHCC